jgi:hypothetical protein
VEVPVGSPLGQQFGRWKKGPDLLEGRGQEKVLEGERDPGGGSGAGRDRGDEGGRDPGGGSGVGRDHGDEGGMGLEVQGKDPEGAIPGYPEQSELLTGRGSRLEGRREDGGRMEDGGWRVEDGGGGWRMEDGGGWRMEDGERRMDDGGTMEGGQRSEGAGREGPYVYIRQSPAVQGQIKLVHG